MMPGMDGFGVLRRLRADGIDALHCSPDRPRHPAGQDHRSDPGRRRLRHQAVQPRGGGGAAPGDPAPHQPERRRFARPVVPSPTSSSTRTPTRCGRPACRFRCRRRSSPAAVLRDQRRNRAEQAEDPRSRLALRLRRRRQRRGVPMCPICGARSTPARNACCTRCAASGTSCGSRG